MFSLFAASVFLEVSVSFNRLLARIIVAQASYWCQVERASASSDLAGEDSPIAGIKGISVLAIFLCLVVKGTSTASTLASGTVGVLA